MGFFEKRRAEKKEKELRLQQEKLEQQHKEEMERRKEALKARSILYREVKNSPDMRLDAIITRVAELCCIHKTYLIFEVKCIPHILSDFEDEYYFRFGKYRSNSIFFLAMYDDKNPNRADFRQLTPHPEEKYDNIVWGDAGYNFFVELQNTNTHNHKSNIENIHPMAPFDIKVNHGWLLPDAVSDTDSHGSLKFQFVYDHLHVVMSRDVEYLARINSGIHSIHGFAQSKYALSEGIPRESKKEFYSKHTFLVRVIKRSINTLQNSVAKAEQYDDRDNTYENEYEESREEAIKREMWTQEMFDQESLRRQEETEERWLEVDMGNDIFWEQQESYWGDNY